MQRGRTGFLGAGQNEVQSLNLSRLAFPHRHQSRTANRIAQLISAYARTRRADIVELFVTARFGCLS